MLYQWHELQHSSLLPVRMWASANMALFGSRLSPFRHNPGSRMIVAARICCCARRIAIPNRSLA